MHIIEEINIRHMVVHILDNQLTVPILSMDEVPSGMDIKDFFASHILKTVNDDALKTCYFGDDSNMFMQHLLDYKEERHGFVDFSKEIATQLFNIMSVHTLIPPCDLAVIEFNLMTKPHIALLKLDYQSTYTHFTDFESKQNVNTIMEYKTTLPGPRQKVSEAVIIRLEDFEVRVLEKKHELDGQLDYYISKHYLKCATKLSSKDQMKIVKQTTDHVAKKFFEDNPEKQAVIKQNLYEALEESGKIDLEKFATETFSKETEVKELFMDKLEKKGLDAPVVQLEERTITRSFEKQRVKTDNGIEIKIPMALYNDPETMEFVTGPDGKIRIILKNIGKIL